MSNRNPSDKEDPASRLAEMLAQSLEELGRPASDKPGRPDETAKPETAAGGANVIEIVPKADPKLPKAGPAPELEAWFEQFQKKVQAEPTVALPKAKPAEPESAPGEANRDGAKVEAKFADLDGRVMEARPSSLPPPAADNDDDIPAAAPAAQTPVDPEAARIIRKVRRLMVVSMLITFIGVGSVFGIIGYRIYKNDGAGGMLFDPNPTAPVPVAASAPAVVAAPAAAPAPPAAPLEKILRLPANARILSAGVAEERLAITIEVDGQIEIRTFDLETLEPAARLGFAATP